VKENGRKEDVLQQGHMKWTEPEMLDLKVSNWAAKTRERKAHGKS
jgi:hypothetical protein